MRMTSSKITEFFLLWNSKAQVTREPNKIDQMKKENLNHLGRNKFRMQLFYIYETAVKRSLFAGIVPN